MKWTLWKAPKGYEDRLAPALVAGAAVHGDTIDIVPTEDYREPVGGGVLIGVVKREILWDHQARGAPLIYLDKGIVRRREVWCDLNMPAWWRMCVGGVHATPYLSRLNAPHDRLARSELLPLAERAKAKPGAHIVLAGSSEKFHRTMGLPHPTEWAAARVQEIMRLTDARIIYRPKPSWKYAEPVLGAEFDHGGKTSLADALRGARCMVTAGSIASVDAVRAGVPCIVLGNAPAAPVSGNRIEDVLEPPWWPSADRLQWAANLSYTSFKPDEIASGVAWGIVKEQAHAIGAL